jgi:hypothetical protein
MWNIVVSMAGPAAEAMRSNGRLRYSMVVAALSGGHEDFRHAWKVIEDYQRVTDNGMETAISGA